MFQRVVSFFVAACEPAVTIHTYIHTYMCVCVYFINWYNDITYYSVFYLYITVSVSGKKDTTFNSIFL